MFLPFHSSLPAAKHLYSSWYGKAAIEGTTYAVTENGWMTQNIFDSWFTTFCERVVERPLLIVLDGHSSHLSLSFIKRAMDANVTVVKLPSHTTHLLQPLDKSCFAPLKRSWNKLLIEYQRRNGHRQISKSEFVDQLCVAWKNSLTTSNIQAGFASTGVYPPDPSKYPIELFHKKTLMNYQSKSGITQPQLTPPPEGQCPIATDIPSSSSRSESTSCNTGSMKETHSSVATEIVDMVRKLNQELLQQVEQRLSVVSSGSSSNTQSLPDVSTIYNFN